MRPTIHGHEHDSVGIVSSVVVVSDVDVGHIVVVVIVIVIVVVVVAVDIVHEVCSDRYRPHHKVEEGEGRNSISRRTLLFLFLLFFLGPIIHDIPSSFSIALSSFSSMERMVLFDHFSFDYRKMVARRSYNLA